MKKNLVIVESPEKARTISRFLGKDYMLMSSYGHVRDLGKKGLNVDVEHDFQPHYVVAPEKQKVVRELASAVKDCDQVWLASDDDREGEAIAWHLAEVLKLPEDKRQRIVFHEITKPAILHALETPRPIKMDLVNAQQARRVLDRLVGYEVSPILWRKVKPSLSAGRVQSVAVRLLVEREREIIAFEAERFYRVQGQFKAGKRFKAELSSRLRTQEETSAFVHACVGNTFTVSNVKDSKTKRSPAPPFTTSTLQQEASRKLGFSASRTMRTAQRLYEQGLISYMRTDSVNLSDQALKDIGSLIVKEYGEAYHQLRRYKTKSKGAQEAHEAIRPTDINKREVAAGDEQRLYDLIRKRVIASQMADARILRTVAEIEGKNLEHHFIAKGEVFEFEGFISLYKEGHDDEKEEEGTAILPKLVKGQKVDLESLFATERYSQHPPRYTEASLVKKLEELGIGRPSTYAPTIDTIVNRGYVLRDDREGSMRTIWQMQLRDGKVTETKVQERYGTERKKLFPSDIGMLVTDFLIVQFPRMMDYTFTAQVEEEFDQIAMGKKSWTEMIHTFYSPFHERVENTLSSVQFVESGRTLGKDPATGLTVLVRVAKFGPVAQIGTSEEVEKPRYAGLRRNQLIETITLEEALELFKLPRAVGEFEGKEMVVAVGRFGPYVRHDAKFFSLGKEDDPYTIDSARAIELIEAKRARDIANTKRIFEEDDTMRVVKMRFSLMLQHGKEKVKLPAGIDWETMTYEEALACIAEAAKTPKKATSKRASKSSTSTGKRASTKRASSTSSSKSTSRGGRVKQAE